ncbi:MAG: cysteine desulfurase [Eubacteriaceae bacterium]|nr:cysteine desulfurase [Eubacteriaceae bacterium]
MDEIYLDNAATTAMSPAALQAMTECMRECFGNPSSLHMAGQRAASRLEEARDIIAEAIGASADEIFFTSGATESNNLALRGFVLSNGAGNVRLVTQATEHPSVLNTANYLRQEGIDVTVLPVDENGMIVSEPDEALFSGDGRTVLLSVMHTNNETGAVFPVEKLAEAARRNGGIYHCDAVQAVGKAPIDAAGTGIDMLSASAHKFHGPKGTGFLYVRKGIDLRNVTFGGEQERSLRPGTVNAPAIWAMAVALRECVSGMEENSERMRTLKALLKRSLAEKCPGIHVNAEGAPANDCTLSVSFPGVGADMLLYGLDREGLRVSAGSACSAGSLEISHVIKAMGAEKYGAPIRFSLSRFTTEEEVMRAAETVSSVFGRLTEK